MLGLPFVPPTLVLSDLETSTAWHSVVALRHGAVLFSVLFGKQVKGFDVPARGLELLQGRSSVALILVRTCLWKREHLRCSWGSRSASSAGLHVGLQDYNSLLFFTVPYRPHFLAVADSDGQGMGVGLSHFLQEEKSD